ncbi:MAG: flavodoxin family protein [Mogibacterium sp.]|nr:flavodoxin family protein [Mogibacterium sp.]
MKITILNGSPRLQGNTSKMTAAFRESAEAAGHTVTEFNVCRMNIKGCLACEYCHGKGGGACIQKDDMQQIYSELQDTDMLVLASPIYYHGISGQLKCAIDRFYSALYPKAPESLRYVAMFLASGDKDQYTGARFSFDGDFLGYLGLEDKGFYTCAGSVTDEQLDEIRAMAQSL